MTPDDAGSPEAVADRLGVWLVGALGDVATTSVLGAAALARGLVGSTGLVSESEACAGIPLAPWASLVFGGHDVRDGDPVASARALADAGVVGVPLVSELEKELSAYGARVRPGVVYGAGEVVRSLESPSARARRADGPLAALAALREDLARFRREHALARVVVVHVASTEPAYEGGEELARGEDLWRALERGAELPASLLYALAAIEEGCPYVNFTPSLGAGCGGLRERARERGVPHMGRDGKTGQTLLRTSLAPMFRARNLRVLSWSGFNILGNRDGAVLDEPAANQAKTQGKDRVLGSILGESLGTSLTRIDYVPSLGDWKTAWDFVHFEGFLGARMQLHCTWHGADSALAAPLVLDLVRLLDAAARAGRSGLQEGLACFFKTPHGVSEQSFPAQVRLLEDYLAELREALASPSA